MGRKKGLVSILLCGVMLSTAGCGTKPYDLSSEEQEKVAAYAAHVVTRYNDRQDEGLIEDPAGRIFQKTRRILRQRRPIQRTSRRLREILQRIQQQRQKSQKQRQYLCDRH